MQVGWAACVRVQRQCITARYMLGGLIHAPVKSAKPHKKAEDEGSAQGAWRWTASTHLCTV